MEGCRVMKVEGNECPKGEKYALSEIENPVRMLTSVVLAEGLSLKMVPVRTSKPIPKSRIPSAMDAIKRITLKVPVKPGDTLFVNFLGLGVDLIATREASCIQPPA
jgi:CxxC motif-containing protein